MCCSSNHYPSRVGMWRCDAETTRIAYSKSDDIEGLEHWHGRLPNNVVACVARHLQSVYALVYIPSMRMTLIKPPEVSTLTWVSGKLVAGCKWSSRRPKELRDQLALAIAEGCTLTRAECKMIGQQYGAKVLVHSVWMDAPKSFSYEEWLKSSAAPVNSLTDVRHALTGEMNYGGFDGAVTLHSVSDPIRGGNHPTAGR